MEKKLVFAKTYNLKAVKQAVETERIDVLENPKKPGSLFMVDDAGNTLGGVSKKIKSAADMEGKVMVVSMVHAEGDEDNKWLLLHEKGEGAAKTVFSF